MVTVNRIIEEGFITVFRGHGSPDNAYKGAGPVPYVRNGDIGNWSIYKNPTASVPMHVYLDVKGSGGVDLQPWDLLLVKEGSYRTGDVGIVLPTDTEILLNSHCVVLRATKSLNPYGIDGLYLAYLLSHPLTRLQIPSKVFIDTTLPNIGDRWKDLKLPVDKDARQRSRIKRQMKQIVERRQEAEELITKLGVRQ